MNLSIGEMIFIVIETIVIGIGVLGYISIKNDSKRK